MRIWLSLGERSSRQKIPSLRRILVFRRRRGRLAVASERMSKMCSSSTLVGTGAVFRVADEIIGILGSILRSPMKTRTPFLVVNTQHTQPEDEAEIKYD
ncbi:hypothetical protein LWI29_006996 [Acer saccharum]|uniref:Uncharacterized protein n=1 Tax=Acer saccharum TaxID=4024 RepID=A0AA39TA69_ACESA|nr:hypothetical protein LWI29_006996 [Acer saccharum]